MKLLPESAKINNLKMMMGVRMRFALIGMMVVLAALVVACDGRGSIVSPHTDTSAAKAKAEWEAKQAQEQQAEQLRCRDEKAAVLSRFEQEMKSGAYAKARLEVYRCSERTGDTDFATKVALAEAKLDEQDVRDLVKKMTARLAPVSETVNAYERLLRYKDKPAFRLAEAHVKRYAKQYEGDKALKLRFEQDDVRPQIGWTQQELVARKGYPRRTNRTVNVRGTSEQWIYCLFDDSKCTYVYMTEGVVTGYQD